MMIRRVTGNSMSPGLEAGDVVIGWRRQARVGSIVVAQQNGREVIKRVEKLEGKSAYLVGDNRHESHDSRHYGSVPLSAILSVVMIHLPRATNPPKPRSRYARKLALALAGVMVVMALAHLIRIDKFIPLVGQILPGDADYAALFVALITTAEVFALPFLLGLRISPLARLVSGIFVVLVPLAWTCFGIWGAGNPNSLGQFSPYVNLPSNVFIILLNLGWLAASYWALWALGYDKSTPTLNKKP